MPPVITVKIHDLSRGGSGVAKLDTGEIVFVPLSAPGDELSIRITEKGKSYSQGEIVEILKPSSLRVTPPCPVFSRCGGCAWQHLPYSLQFETKVKGLLHSLKKVQIDSESVPFDPLPSEKPYGYRNRIQLHGNSDSKTLGFYARGSKTIVDIDRCEISSDAINEALPALKQEGFTKFTGDFKLEIDADDKSGARAAWNQKHAAFGFRQVNDEQNQKMVDWVGQWTKPADILFDLYGGFGNLSLPLADRFSRVDCVDLFTQRTPAEVPENFRYQKMDITRWSQTKFSSEELKKTASFILDPPREGIGALMGGLEQKMSQLKIKSLILVGCDVDSFARDCGRLAKHGFKLQRLAALDLFPQTPHLESLALFSK